ncbi:MAG: phosphoglucosamine mutase [Candidatus Omnitrophota bacterium]|jgi:phosphoglucosamine mutase
MKKHLFGTDGIRGTPGVYPLTDGMLVKIAKAIADFVLSQKPHGEKNCVVIGKDTRLSGRQIERIIAETISSCGVNVLLAGTITTPGLSFLVRDLGCNTGIMISASHNKASDNGIKLFNHLGHKLSPKEEEHIEYDIFCNMTDTRYPKNTRKTKSTITTVKDSQKRYINFLISTVKGLNLKGTCVALDCAWGAASPFAKKIFTTLGATVKAIHDKPSGRNINEGGAISPHNLKDIVVKTNADIGIAVDGDGDRGILIDEKGAILDGDYTMAVIAGYLLRRGELPHKSIIATVMSNLGLQMALEPQGIKIIRTDVGDKHVLEALLKHKVIFGGEQSGHIIFLNYLPAPDGLLTALQMLKIMKDTRLSLSRLCQCFKKYPQILINIKVKEKKHFEDIPLLSKKLKHYETKLKTEGRILLRYSGTELLARVMVEGKDKTLVEETAHTLAQLIQDDIGIPG